MTYIDELSGEAFEPTEIKRMNGDRTNWLTEEQGRSRDHNRSGGAWGLYDDGGRDGARWFPIVNATT